MRLRRKQEEQKIFKTKNPIKKLLSVRFWLFSLLAILTVSALVYAYLLLFSNNRSGELSYTLDKGIEKIELVLPVAHLYLQSWDKDYVGVSFEFFKSNSSRKQLKVRKKDGVWQFRWDRTCVLNDWQIKFLPLFKIYVPEVQIKKVDFKVNYGIVELGGFKNCTFNGFLNGGELLVHEQSMCQGQCQIGWGDICVRSAVEDMTWQKSTGFTALMRTGQNKVLKLITCMGRIKSGELN